MVTGPSSRREQDTADRRARSSATDGPAPSPRRRTRRSASPATDHSHTRNTRNTRNTPAHTGNRRRPHRPAAPATKHTKKTAEHAGRRRSRTDERHLKAPEWTQVDTPLRLLAFALATSDPQKRFRRFMAVLVALLGSAVLVLGAAIATLWLAPHDSTLTRILFTALGVGAASTGIAGRRLVQRRSRLGGTPSSSPSEVSR
jgi:hypothetical protein